MMRCTSIRIRPPGARSPDGRSRTCRRRATGAGKIPGQRCLQSQLSVFEPEPGREIEAYREVVPFQRLAFLTQKVLEGTHLEEFQSRIAEDFRQRGIEATFLTVEDSVDTALAALPNDIEAVLLGGMPHLTDVAFKGLVRGLIERKLPSFSLVGQRDVRRGVLAGLKRDRNEQRLVRRVALNLFNVLLGQDAAEMPVDFQLATLAFPSTQTGSNPGAQILDSHRWMCYAGPFRDITLTTEDSCA